MKFTIIELENLSGRKTKIYSVAIDDDPITLYEKFIIDNETHFYDELVNLDTRLEIIGSKTGLFEASFKTGAGRFGENICSFRDRPKARLRLLFIEFGNAAIVVGGGAHKPANARATQDVPKLNAQKELLGLISTTLKMATAKGHFKINDNGTIFTTTNYIYNTQDYESSRKKK